MLALLAEASNKDMSVLFLLLVFACAAMAVYFLAVQNWIGAGVSAFVAVVLAVFLL